MKVRLIMAQYKCAYPGQYAPNVVAAWDEYTLEDNWEGYVRERGEFKAQVPNDFDWVRELVINVPDDAIDRLAEPPEVDVAVEES
jgi:hypothetical protein